MGILLASCVIHSKQLVPNKDSFSAPLKILILFLTLMVLIIPISYDPEISKGRLYDFFRYVLMFYLVGRIVSDFKKYQYYILILITCTTYLSWTAHSHFTGGRLDGVGLPDAQEANAFATLIVLMIPMMVASALIGRIWQKAIALAGILLSVNAFAMTRSRGAFVGLLMQFIIATILFRKNKHRKKLIFGVVGVVILFGVLMDDQFKSRLLNLQKNVLEGEAAGVSAGRVEIWKYGLNMISDYPLGVGGGGFRALSPQYVPKELLSRTYGEIEAHNAYLQVLVEEGWIGMAIYLTFIFSIIYTMLKVLSMKDMIADKSDGKAVTFHAYMLIISLFGFWAASFFGNRIYFEGYYLVAALAPAVLKICRNISISENIEEHSLTKNNLPR